MPKRENPARDTAEGFTRIKKEVEAHRRQRWAKVRTEILLDLANLPDDSCASFRRQFRILDVSVTKDNPAILQFRDQLRRFWSANDPDGDALHFWVNKARVDHKQTWVVSVWADGSHTVHPNYHILSLSLAIAASEWRSKMAICGNPECPQPYFLKGRKNQRFCDRPACSAYGQRQHKKKWWSEHGEEWKVKWERVRTSSSKAHRKRGRQNAGRPRTSFLVD
jgi:hypothetical protein